RRADWPVVFRGQPGPRSEPERAGPEDRDRVLAGRQGELRPDEAREPWHRVLRKLRPNRELQFPESAAAATLCGGTSQRGPPMGDQLRFRLRPHARHRRSDRQDDPRPPLLTPTRESMYHSETQTSDAAHRAHDLGLHAITAHADRL